MASGFGLNGEIGKCFPMFQDFVACMVRKQKNSLLYNMQNIVEYLLQLCYIQFIHLFIFFVIYFFYSMLI
jgi:hypothetical protein